MAENQPIFSEDWDKQAPATENQPEESKPADDAQKKVIKKTFKKKTENQEFMMGKNWLESGKLVNQVEGGAQPKANDGFVVFTMDLSQQRRPEAQGEEAKDVREEAPKPKVKKVKEVEEAKDEVLNLEELAKIEPSGAYAKVDESRQVINIVFIGHVDCGKSTTCGQILYLTGKVDETDIRKYEQEAKEKQRDSWYFAYIMDINPEEREKGKTVEVGKAHFVLDKRRFVLLDAPGHKNYVSNMLAGASQADVAALVISAKTGEFESGFEKDGQTKEHALLAKSLGVSELICLVNKMDEVQWSQQRFEEIQKSVNPFLADVCYYDTTKITWIPYSGLQGLNIKERVSSSVCSWYNGPSLFEYLDNIQPPKRDPAGGVRIPILDKFRDQGLMVFGKVEGGTIKEDLNLTLMPYRQPVQIKQIYNSEDQRIYYAKPGENLKLQLKGIEDDQIKRGFMITSNANRCMVCLEFEAEIDLLEIPEPKHIMSSGYQCVIHIHTAMEEVQITAVLAEIDRKSKQEKKASFLKSYMGGRVRLSSKTPLCLEKYTVNESLGRFTLRDLGKTIAIGQVTKVKPYVQEN
eukprot:TRINITY_DN3242_c0_g1_i1.p1 TRINITY_DN3242_c0_g1~~TRINITY_DN3242_c0_g1_i1.p1  ORF type:complete len:577 (+),score=197.44 TRINITY_DN3242_c0_g1_i1:132-1862(+)